MINTTFFRHHILASPYTTHFKELAIVIDDDGISASKQHIDTVVMFGLLMFPSIEELVIKDISLKLVGENLSPEFQTSFNKFASKIKRLTTIDVATVGLHVLLPNFTSLKSLEIVSNAESDAINFAEMDGFLPALLSLPLLTDLAIVASNRNSIFYLPPMPADLTLMSSLTTLVIDVGVIADDTLAFIASFQSLDSLIIDVCNWVTEGLTTTIADDWSQLSRLRYLKLSAPFSRTGNFLLLALAASPLLEVEIHAYASYMGQDLAPGSSAVTLHSYATKVPRFQFVQCESLKFEPDTSWDDFAEAYEEITKLGVNAKVNMKQTMEWDDFEEHHAQGDGFKVVRQEAKFLKALTQGVEDTKDEVKAAQTLKALEVVQGYKWICED